MLDERALIASVEAAEPEQLAQIFARPTADEEKALRAYLGDERYERMHRAALMRGEGKVSAAPRGKVIVIPSWLGSELSSYDGSGACEHIWLDALNIGGGELDRLR